MPPEGHPFLFSDLVRILTMVAASIGIVLCLLIVFRRRDDSTGEVHLAHITLPRVAFYKLLALVALLGGPILAVAGGTWGLLEDTKKVSQCGSCHPMVLFVNDMRDPASENLAARHFRNKWIPEEQCYHCHADYGFQGTIDAKLGGVGHIVRYLTGTYKEPIPLRDSFRNSNCLFCHGDTPKYDAQEMHTDNATEIASDETSCIACHDSPHPSEDERTPGNPVYERLMKGAS